jgi:hypothetical protein
MLQFTALQYLQQSEKKGDDDSTNTERSIKAERKREREGEKVFVILLLYNCSQI